MKKIFLQTVIVVSFFAVTSCGKDVKTPNSAKPAPAAKPTSSTVTTPTSDQSGNNHTCGNQSTTTTDNSNSSSGSMGY